MYGQTQTYKQIQSFGLSAEPLGNDLPDRNRLPRWDAKGKFNLMRGLALNVTNKQNLVTNTFAYGSGTVQYNGAVAFGKFVYLLPRSASFVGKINTETDTAQNIGPSLGATANKWLNGCLARNGFIYCTPFAETRVLKINTADDSISFIPNVNPLGASRGWTAFVEAANGFLYAMPISGTSAVLKLNPFTDTFEVAPQTFAGASYLKLIPFGDYLYAFPFAATNCFKYDTRTDRFTTFGTIGGLTSRFNGGCVSHNGLLFAPPYSLTAVGVINPQTDTFTTFGAVGSTPDKWVGLDQGMDGFLYSAPLREASVLRVDPVNLLASTFGSLGTGTKWAGSAIAENGKMYSAPYDSNTVLITLNSLSEKLNPNLVNRIERG